MEDLDRLMFWQGKRVLVTGATGVIGINLVNRLEEYGAETVTIVRDWVPQSKVLGSWLSGDSKVTIVRGELEDFNLIMRTLAEYEIEYVFHLGAQTIVQVGNTSPLTTFRANIEGTWNLLESARIINQYGDKIRAVCIASSDKAYGTSKKLPYTEEMPLAGEHPYDVSKSCTDLLARCYGLTYHLPVFIARMGNIYGPGDLNFNRLIPGTIRSILENKSLVLRSDGTPIREYFYVEDAVDAYLTMAEKSGTMKEFGEAFNFSSGEKLSVLEVVRKILAVMGSDLEPVIRDSAKNEIHAQYLSIRKATRILKWRPKYTLDMGLIPTIDWYRSVFS